MRLTFEEELPLWVGCPRNSEEARGGMCHEGRRQPVHHCVITIVIIINSSSYYHHMVEGEEKLHITGLFLDALASLDLKLSVSEWVIYRCQLAHLQVFQSYFHHYYILAKFCLASNQNCVINIDMMSASDGLNNTLHLNYPPSSSSLSCLF